jgi:hypothetical protein
MRTEFKHRSLYIHETTHLRTGSVERFTKEFTEHYQPLMERNGARLFGLWQGTPFNSNWDEVSTIWEIDGYAGFGALGKARHQDPVNRKAFGQWDNLLGEMGATGEGRLTYANRNIKSLDELKASGLKTTVVIQEFMTTKPGRQEEYIEQLEYAYVPWSERTGKKWLGSFTTIFRNEEVIHYWALDGGWDGFAQHYPSWKGDIPADIKSWMKMAPALRDSWDDSILQSLSPNPLG